MNHPEVVPVTATERIATLDVLRAFALLGILVMNMPAFFATVWSPLTPEQRWPSEADRAAWWLMDTLFSGKFNSLFSFLFGIGFAIQLERLLARSPRPIWTYFRRLIALFLFGVAHGALLWMGDVLHMYAILGAALVLLRRLSDKLILALIVIGLLTPTAFSLHELFTYTLADEQSDRDTIARIENVGKRRSTRTRQGAPWLKTTLVQTAWAASRKKQSDFHAQFLRLKSRRGPKKAILAVAASMLTDVYYMLRDGVEFHDLGDQYFAQHDKARLTTRLLQRLRDLGVEVEVEVKKVA